MIRKFWGLYCFVLGCFLCNSVWAEENPDEYRDCVQYSIEEAIAATALYGNQVTFTFSGFTKRLDGNNSDCANIENIEGGSTPDSDGDSGAREDDDSAIIPGVGGEAGEDELG